MSEERLSQLPPLHALRSFHAAARCGRFREAAGALGLSESAVSHQVRKLEDHLGVRLFDRAGNAVRLTLAGQTYFDEIDPAFSRIRRATEALAGPVCRVSLTLPTSLATLWLIPRLGQLEAALPEINLQMIPSNRVVDLRREQVELGIRYGQGSWSGLNAVRLFGEQAFPVLPARAPWPRRRSGETLVQRTSPDRQRRAPGRMARVDTGARRRAAAAAGSARARRDRADASTRRARGSASGSGGSRLSVAGSGRGSSWPHSALPTKAAAPISSSMPTRRNSPSRRGALRAGWSP